MITIFLYCNEKYVIFWIYLNRSMLSVGFYAGCEPSHVILQAIFRHRNLISENLSRFPSTQIISLLAFLFPDIRQQRVDTQETEF